MSKHILPATEMDNERVVWLRPDDDPRADPGWRYRLDKQKGDLLFFIEEQVLPERVNSPNAYRVLNQKCQTVLKKRDVVWFRDALNEVLALEEDW